VRKLRVSTKAESDLVDIVASLSDYSERAAQRLTDAVVETYDTLVEFPLLGPACDQIKPGWRFFSVDGNYLIFYRVTDESVDILHVVHGMRDLVNLYAAET
jgi:toxin ParE1/3/4